MEQDHLPCSCDQEVFERVWRRVMPEDRPDCPLPWARTLPPLRPSSPPRWLCLPWYILLQPANRHPPGPWWEKSTTCPAWGRPRRCTAPSSSGSLTGNWRIGGPIGPVRAQGNGQVLATIAADERRHAKRLSTAYFLISGVRYWPVDRCPIHPPPCSPPPCGKNLHGGAAGGGRLPDRGGGDRRSLPPRALSGAGGEEDSRLAPAQRTGQHKNTPAHGWRAPEVSVDHSVQHPGRHRGRVRTGTAVLHQHHEGVGASGLRRSRRTRRGGLAAPTSAVPLLAHTSMLGKREAPYWAVTLWAISSARAAAVSPSTSFLVCRGRAGRDGRPRAFSVLSTSPGMAAVPPFCDGPHIDHEGRRVGQVVANTAPP